MARSQDSFVHTSCLRRRLRWCGQPRSMRRCHRRRTWRMQGDVGIGSSGALHAIPKLDCEFQLRIYIVIYSEAGLSIWLHWHVSSPGESRTLISPVVAEAGCFASERLPSSAQALYLRSGVVLPWSRPGCNHLFWSNYRRVGLTGKTLQGLSHVPYMSRMKSPARVPVHSRTAADE